MNNILLIGFFDELYVDFISKKYNDHNIHYWCNSKIDKNYQNVKYHFFDNFQDETLQFFLKNSKISYDMILVSSLDYWDNIRIIRNIPYYLRNKGILIINNITHRDEFYLDEIKLYGHNLLYDSVQFINKTKFLFSSLFPFIGNLFSSNNTGHLILLKKK